MGFFVNGEEKAREHNIYVSIVEDDPVFSRLLERTLELNENFVISKYANSADFLQNLHKNPDIVVLDYKLPETNGIELLKKIKKYSESIKTIVVSGQDDVEVVVQTYKTGADDYIVKNENCLPEIENSIKNLSENITLSKEVEKLKSQVLDREKYSKIIGNSAAVLKILKNIQKAERTKILVLITGESGTGKELVARAIHFNSDRKKKPFVPVNMAAIPKDLIESELFGHEKGAFTGASAKRIGKFEEASEGTIFLDEIGEMDLSLQSKLLRILEDKQVVRIGSNKVIDLNIRIIAATNKNLFEEVKKGNFREDLYYRLQGFLINLPPLKNRRDDIFPLAKHFLQVFAEKNDLGDISFSKEALKYLYNYSWPGNIRELKAVVERAALLADGNIITTDDLMIEGAVEESNFGDQERTLEEYKNKIISEYLDKYDNNVDTVAKKLAVGKATIYRFLKKIAD